MSKGVDIPQNLLQQVHEHAIKEYPSECCGMIFAPKDGDGFSRVRPCVNAQDKYHELDPDTFPRDSKTAYFIDPRELLAIEKELSNHKERIAVIYHSHPDVDAYFSEEDVRRAVSEGEPIYPGTDYLVMSVIKGQLANEKIFRWDEASKEFTE